MKFLKQCPRLGTISVVSFFVMAILGQLLRPDYNPITNFVSELTADGSPHTNLMRFFAYTSYTLLIVFAIYMAVETRTLLLKWGFSALALMALTSSLGYGAFPMTVELIVSAKNMIHIIITAAISLITILAMVLITLGYLKQENSKRLGRISTICAGSFILFNFALLFAIFNHSNALGLIQRLGIYTFYGFIFILSWHYVKHSVGKKA